MSIKRTYPDNSLFTNASAHIDGYNGLVIDTTNSAQISIGTTNASSIVMGNGVPVHINGFFSPTNYGATLGENSSPWGVFWCDGPISTASNTALTLQSYAVNATNAENVIVSSFYGRDSTSSLFKLKNGSANALNFDGYGNLIYNVFDLAFDRSISISEPATTVDGYSLSIFAGQGGSTTGTKGGHLHLDAGAGNGNIDGYVYVGTTHSEQVHIGITGKKTYVDGYLGVDGYATLSHDVGNTNVLALTQNGNTTTGADLRLRHLKFFSDNVPTNQAPQSIYATGGDLVLSSTGQNVFIDAPEVYWAQNANIYTGGFNLQVGPAANYIIMNYSITNVAVGYDFVSTISGASVGDNISLRHTYDITQLANNINNIGHKIILTDHTNDGYTGGSDVGLLIDVSGGANTSNTRYAAKLTGGITEIDGYLVQTSGAISMTANATSQISTTSGDLSLRSAGTVYVGTGSTAIQVSGTTFLAVNSSGITCYTDTAPYPDNTRNLGVSTQRWSKLWTYNADIDGYLFQANGQVSLTANTTSQISTTSGNLTVDSAATLKLGAINATTTTIGRDGYVFEVDAYGHLITLNAMSPTINTGTGAGTTGTPTATITGHDVDGYITVNTTTSAASNAVIVTITFANNFPNPPRNILLSPGNVNSADQSGTSAAFTPVIGATNGPTVSTWTIMSGTNGLSNNTTYIWNYLVIG